MVSLGFRDGSQYEHRSDTTTSLVGVGAGGERATGHLGSGLDFSLVFQKLEWA
jgi:hypothetical protein